MSDEYDVYIEQSGFSLDLEIEVGAAGAPGIQGPVGPPITVRELDGSPTVAATELVLPNGTLTVAGSVATVANLASLGANVFTAKQAFSGTDHVGLCLNSLTTAQYNALTPENGDLFRDSTTDRIDARLARGTVELVDTAGGQTINGTLTVNGNLNAASAFFQLSNRILMTATNSSILRITDAAAAAGFSIDCATDNQMTIRNRANTAAGNLNVGNLTASGTVTGGDVWSSKASGSSVYAYDSTSGAFVRIQSTGTITHSSGTLTFPGLLDLRKGAAANVLQFSNTAFLRTDTSQLSIFDTGIGRSNIALWRGGNFVVGSTTLIAASSGADATGSVVDISLSRASATTWQMGDGGLNANGNLSLNGITASGTIRLGTFTVGTLPSAAANTRARAFVSDSNLSFSSANLGSTVTAGGSTLVPVFSNGTNWVIG